MNIIAEINTIASIFYVFVARRDAKASALRALFYYLTYSLDRVKTSRHFLSNSASEIIGLSKTLRAFI